MFNRLFLLLLLSLPIQLVAQCPSFAGFLQHATQIQPGLWMADAEVSVRDYQGFLYYVLKDSGEVMFRRSLPPTELLYKDRIMFYGWDYPYWNETQTLVEVDHPVMGVTQAQGLAYCDWLSIFCKRMNLYKDPEATAIDNPAIRFRLPTPKEWLLGALWKVPPKTGADYKETPSRYLFTRTVNSARPGEKQLHFQDNVSELTSDSTVVMGGNVDWNGLLPSKLSGTRPDMRMGFRIVLELPDSLISYLQKVPRRPLRKCNRETHLEDERQSYRTYQPRDEFYPYNLKQRCFEISSDLWMSKTEVTAAEYAFQLLEYLRDSGAIWSYRQLPSGLKSKSDTTAIYEAQPGNVPITGVNASQAKQFCAWLTRRNFRWIPFPAVRYRYLFRLPTAEESAAAMAVDPAIQAKDPLQGFRYVVEVMPEHPDAKGWKQMRVWKHSRHERAVRF